MVTKTVIVLHLCCSCSTRGCLLLPLVQCLGGNALLCYGLVALGLHRDLLACLRTVSAHLTVSDIAVAQ